MFKAKIENFNGDVLTLTGNEAVYQIVSIIGLNPPKAQINTTKIVGMDGAIFNSSKLGMRNVVLTVKINGDVEANRLNLYSYFQTKSWCKFYYSNDSLDVFIEGYVESVECDLFSSREMAQISILCPFPYFQSIAENTASSSNVISGFVFPFSINMNDPIPISEISPQGAIQVFNSSESESGTIIEINFRMNASSVELINTRSGETFELDYAFLQNDKVIVNTQKGAKSVTLVRNGVVSNLFSALKKGSVFIQLSPANNIIDYSVDGQIESGAVYIVFKFHNAYRGV